MISVCRFRIAAAIALAAATAGCARHHTTTGLVLKIDEPSSTVTISHDPANRTITRRDNNTEAVATAFTDGVITNLTFQYLDVNRAVTAVDNQVCYVRISVTATTRRRDPRTNQPVSFTVTDEVRVRVR